MEYANTLIKNRTTEGAAPGDEEESWTFIGDESDPELARRIAEWDPVVAAANRGRTGVAGRAVVESDLGA